MIPFGLILKLYIKGSTAFLLIGIVEEMNCNNLLQLVIVIFFLTNLHQMTSFISIGPIMNTFDTLMHLLQSGA